MARALGLGSVSFLALVWLGACGGSVDKNGADSGAGAKAAGGAGGAGATPSKGGAGKGGASTGGTDNTDPGVGAAPGTGGSDACSAPRDEAPGEPVYSKRTLGEEACSVVSLSERLSAIYALRPDLNDIQELYVPDTNRVGDGSFVYAFLKPDGGFAIVMQRGSGDCESGCIQKDYWYFETGADCEVSEVGEAHVGQDCLEPDQLPRWGVPRAVQPSQICDADLSAQDVSGTYSVVTCGQATDDCFKDQDKSGSARLPELVSFTIQQFPDDLSTGTITFTRTNQPELDGVAFEAKVERRKVTASVMLSNLPAKCIEDSSLEFEYDFEGFGQRRLIFDRSYTPDCERDPGNYCKAQASATFGDATREADACALVECAGLDEAACKARPATDTSKGCLARYGTPWQGDDEPVYLGCATTCCDGEDCAGAPDVEVCVVSPDHTCWMISSPPAPDGWREVFETCENEPECAP